MPEPIGFDCDEECFEKVIAALSPLTSDPICGDLTRMLIRALETGKQGGLFYISAEIPGSSGKFSTVSNDRGVYEEDMR